MHTQSLAWYEATEEANLLKKPLPGVDNGRQQQYTIQVFSLQGQHVKCTAKHIENELYVAKCSEHGPICHLFELILVIHANTSNGANHIF
jgi:hypothetical protein